MRTSGTSPEGRGASARSGRGSVCSARPSASRRGKRRGSAADVTVAVVEQQVALRLARGALRAAERRVALHVAERMARVFHCAERLAFEAPLDDVPRPQDFHNSVAAVPGDRRVGVLDVRGGLLVVEH